MILGDEPAGLWLAEKLASRPDERGWLPRVAWVSVTAEKSARPFPLPRLIAEAFEIAAKETWFSEIITPRECFSWNEGALSERFGGLPWLGCEGPKDPRSLRRALTRIGASSLAQARQAISRHPELLAFASGVVKILGRADVHSPEAALISSLLASEMTWWDPEKNLPAGVEKIRLSPFVNPVEEVNHSRRHGISVAFRDGTALFARNLVLNLSYGSLITLCQRNVELLRLLGLFGELRAEEALFPLRLRVESSTVPCPVRPLTIAFDTADIPDIRTEWLPFFVRERENREKEIELWVGAQREVSLETTLELMAKQLGKLHRLFPFLSQGLLSQNFTLGIDACFSDDKRAEMIREMERERLEIYALTAFRATTRHASLWSLLPFLNAHLNYPLGTLSAAQEIWERSIPKRKASPAKVTLRQEGP